MEFREYWHIIWRRRHVVVPLVVVTFVASLVFNLVLPPVYKTDTTVYVQAIIPPPVSGAPEYYSSEYFRTLYSEYLADDLGVIIKTKDFAEKVAARIASRYGDTVAVKDVLDAISTATKKHRTLKITIATGSERLTRLIGEALDDVLRTDGFRYFTRDDRQPVQVNVVDPPRDVTSPGLLRRLLEVLLHTAVAVVVGAGLAFLLHYLDDRIQDEDDAARTTGWVALGAIPADSPAGGPPAGLWWPALIRVLPLRGRAPADGMLSPGSPAATNGVARPAPSASSVAQWERHGAPGTAEPASTSGERKTSVGR